MLIKKILFTGLLSAVVSMSSGVGHVYAAAEQIPSAALVGSHSGAAVSGSGGLGNSHNELMATASVQKNSAPAAQPLWISGAKKNKIIVVSDLHFGVDDKFAETVHNRRQFINFLQQLAKTADVRELVIAGDFLDEWFLPMNYEPITDLNRFFLAVAENNKGVLDGLQHLMKSGVKVTYVIGNHDMNLKKGLLSTLLPGITEKHDAKGLGRHITGDRQEIIIEHGHRYDPYSAPDRVSNRELLGNDDTIYPPGYFYARRGTSWVVENRPKNEANYPSLTKMPAKENTDQMGAYFYSKMLEALFKKLTANEGFTEKAFVLKTGGFNGRYSLEDMYPVLQADGTISAPVLFRNFQRSWEKRQAQNDNWVKIPFLKAAAESVKPEYFYECAKIQYLENPKQKFDVVVFGHTHIPDFQKEGSKVYVNSGTWVDHNVDHPLSMTFVSIETGERDKVALYRYIGDGTAEDVSQKLTIKTDL